MAKKQKPEAEAEAENMPPAEQPPADASSAAPSSDAPAEKPAKKAKGKKSKGDEKPAPKFERVQVESEKRYASGGKMDYEQNKVSAGHGLKVIDAVYVDNDGSSYPAKVLPLPLNKGYLTKVPRITDIAREQARIMKLPAEHQAEAFQKMSADLANPADALAINGNIVRLEPYKGHLCRSIEQNGQIVPVFDIEVNFSKRPDVEDWRGKRNVMPEEYVPKMPKGQPTIPYVKLS